jgi:Helix-hairpin-helix motif
VRRPTNASRPSIADLNRESAVGLERLLPGVGEVLASNIVEHRNAHGAFESVADLAKVPRMGARRAERLWAAIDTTLEHVESAPEISLSEAHGFGLEDSLVEDPVMLEFLAHPPVSASQPPPANRDELGAVAGPDARPEQARRRVYARLAAVGFVALTAGVFATIAMVKSVRESSVAIARADVNEVRAEVQSLRNEVGAVGSAQLGSSLEHQADSGRTESIEKRLVEHDRAQADTKKRVQAVEERAKKIEEKQDKHAARLSKAEDDIAWQKMATAAQLAALKKQVRSAADQIEALDDE